MRRLRSRGAGAAAGACAAVLLLPACEAVSEPVVGVPSPEPVQRPVDVRCTDPPPELVETVAERVTVDAELEHPKLVASEDEPDVHFLSAELVGLDVPSKPPVGTWAVRGPLDAPEPAVLAVGAVASAYSDWPDGTGSGGLSLTDDGGEESIVCVEGAG